MNPTAGYELTIVIPVYNEQESLSDLLQALSEYKNHASVKTGFLLVNDASTDHSLSIINEFCTQARDFYYLSLEKRCGLTGALKAGFSRVRSPWTGYMDADLQTLPEDFELLLKNRFQGALICGERNFADMPLLLRLRCRSSSFLRRLITHDGIKDATCPLKIIKTQLVSELPLFSGMHRFLPALTKMTGNRVFAVRVRWQRRRHGRSKFSFLSRTLHSLTDLMAFIWIRSHYIDPAVAERNFELDDDNR